MKGLRLPIALFAALLLTGCAQPPPPAEQEVQPPPMPLVIIMEDHGEYLTLLEAEAMTEEELQLHLERNGWYMNGMEDRQDVLHMLSLLQPISLPAVEGAKLTAIHYYPEREDATVYWERDGIRITLGVDMHAAAAEEYAREHILPYVEELIADYRQDGEDIRVYSLDTGEEAGFIPFLIETGGAYMTARVFAREDLAQAMMKYGMRLMPMEEAARPELWK